MRLLSTRISFYGFVVSILLCCSQWTIAEDVFDASSPVLQRENACNNASSSLSTKYESSFSLKEKIIQGFELGHKLFTKIQNSEFMEVVNNLSKWAMPLLQSLGSFAKVLLDFQDNDSKELKFIKEQFTLINNKMDTMDQEFGEIKRMIDWNAIKIGFGEYERTINVMQDNLVDLMSAPDDVKPMLRQQFIMLQERDFGDANGKLFHGLVNRNSIFTDNLIAAIRKFTLDHQRKVQKFVMGAIQLLLKGMEVEMTYMSFKGYSDESIQYWQCNWERRLQNMSAVFQKVDKEIRANWYSQMENDVDVFNAQHHLLSNQQYTSSLATFLRDKFPHRSWFVMTYKPITGSDNHFTSACGGHTQHQLRNHNVVVASADAEEEQYFNAALAQNELDNLPTSILSWSSEPAEYMVNLLKQRLRFDCKVHSLVAAVNLGSDLWYSVEKGRYAYRLWQGTYHRFINLNKDLNLLVFG